MKAHKSRWLAVSAAALSAAVALAGCTGSPSSSQTTSGSYTPGVLSKAYSGTTISVMLPPWGAWSKQDLQDFTAKTGINVDMQTLAWDSIHDKVVTSEASGQAPADIVEMDWSWVSQFGAAGWFTSLDKYLSKQQLKDSVGANVFVHDGHQIGVPYGLDFRGTEVDMTMLKKAGIATPPKTWKDILTDAEAVKRAGVVAYPIGLPLKILEGTSTPWYALVRAAGGQILTPQGQPAFTKGGIGQAALQFIHDAYAKGLIDPGAINLEDTQVGDNFAAGQSAILVVASPGASSTFTNPTTSKIAQDSLKFVHEPGQSNDSGPTVGLEDALSVPQTSKNKEAAAMFISWWLQKAQLLKAYNNPNMADLPPSHVALQELASTGKLPDATTVLQSSQNIQPIFPGGAPTWYSKFSSAVAATVQSVAIGNETASAGIAKLAQQTKQFAAQGQ